MSHIGKHIFVDDFIRQRNGSDKNFPKYIKSPVVKEWREPSEDPTRSGKEFVQTEDGEVYYRYDCYAVDSPYGWGQEGKSKFNS